MNGALKHGSRQPNEESGNWSCFSPLAFKRGEAYQRLNGHISEELHYLADTATTGTQGEPEMDSNRDRGEMAVAGSAYPQGPS